MTTIREKITNELKTVFTEFTNRKNQGQREIVIFSGFKESIETSIFLFDNNKPIGAMMMLRPAYEAILWYVALYKNIYNEEKFIELINCFDYDNNKSLMNFKESFSELSNILIKSLVKHGLRDIDDYKPFFVFYNKYEKEKKERFFYDYLCQFSHLSSKHTKEYNKYSNTIDMPTLGNSLELSYNDTILYFLILNFLILSFGSYSKSFEKHFMLNDLK